MSENELGRLDDGLLPYEIREVCQKALIKFGAPAVKTFGPLTASDATDNELFDPEKVFVKSLRWFVEENLVIRLAAIRLERGLLEGATKRTKVKDWNNGADGSYIHLR